MAKGKLLNREDSGLLKGERYGKIEELEKRILYKKVIEWNEEKLVLEDGTIIEIEMSESECCAYAGGEFKNVKLDALITDIHISEVKEGTSDWGYIENKATVTLFHNQNPIAQADMEAGHNGYYYSVGSLVIDNIHFPVVDA